MVQSTALNSFKVAMAIRDGALGTAKGLTKVFSYGEGTLGLSTILAGGCPLSFVRKYDDFTSDSTDLTVDWTIDQAATATAFAWSASLGGMIRLATGTTDNAGGSINGPAIYQGDKNAFFLARYKWSAVTGFQMEHGFGVTPTEDKENMFSDLDVPTAAAGTTDGAVMAIDTDQTATTFRLVTIDSVGTTTDGTATPKDGRLASATNRNFTPTAATYFGLMIALNGNDVHGAIFDENWKCQAYASGVTMEGGTLVSPWVFGGTRNTTDKNFDMDMYLIMQDR